MSWWRSRLLAWFWWPSYGSPFAANAVFVEDAATSHTVPQPYELARGICTSSNPRAFAYIARLDAN